MIKFRRNTHTLDGKRLEKLYGDKAVERVWNGLGDIGVAPQSHNSRSMTLVEFILAYRDYFSSQTEGQTSIYSSERPMPTIVQILRSLSSLVESGLYEVVDERSPTAAPIIKFERCTWTQEEDSEEKRRVWQESEFMGPLGDSNHPLTFAEFVEEHMSYHHTFPGPYDGAMPTVAQMLRGLASLVEANLYSVIDESSYAATLRFQGETTCLTSPKKSLDKTCHLC